MGFDWPDVDGVLAKLEEETAELLAAISQRDTQAVSDELGDCLFTLVNLARHVAVSPEQALLGTVDRFERRFRAMETLMASLGEQIGDLSINELERRWQRAKESLA